MAMRRALIVLFFCFPLLGRCIFAYQNLSIVTASIHIPGSPTARMAPAGSPFETEIDKEMLGPSLTSTPVPFISNLNPEHEPGTTFGPGQEVIIYQMRMFDEEIGWAIATLREGPDHVVATRDGGNTWHDVTPPDEVAIEKERSVSRAMLFASDEDTAWVTYHTELDQREAVVWRTRDGGSTWQVSQPLERVEGGLPQYYGPWMLFFVDPLHGWLVERYDKPGQINVWDTYMFLFRTIDGGKTWEPIITHPTNDTGRWDGNRVTGLDFGDSQTGITTYQSGDRPRSLYLLDWTFDGGLTWVPQELPSPWSDDKVVEDSYCIASSPYFISPTSVILVVDCILFGESQRDSYPTTFSYMTGDRGQTWDVWPFPGGEIVYARDDQSLVCEVNVGDTMYSRAYPTSFIHYTKDGGRNWIQKFSYSGGGIHCYFIDEDLGWVTFFHENDYHLGRTTDGCQTWDYLDSIIMAEPGN